MKTNEKIRQLREARAWTQEEMATKLSMTTQGYAKIERGETRSNLDRLEQISKVFGIDIVELLAFGEEHQLQFNHLSNNENITNTYFAVGKEAMDSEIRRLQLILAHKDEIIENLKRENKLLVEMNELLKNSK